MPTNNLGCPENCTCLLCQTSKAQPGMDVLALGRRVKQKIDSTAPKAVRKAKSTVPKKEPKPRVRQYRVLVEMLVDADDAEAAVWKTKRCLNEKGCRGKLLDGGKKVGALDMPVSDILWRVIDSLTWQANDGSCGNAKETLGYLLSRIRYAPNDIVAPSQMVELVGELEKLVKHYGPAFVARKLVV